jgi:precorrin-6B methylase 2
VQDREEDVVPELDTALHLHMFKRSKQRRSLPRRILKAVRTQLSNADIYGLEWGDPETCPPLRYARDHFLQPYISPQSTVVEIGPGGGRWTRYMLGAGRIYAVDYHQELLDELRTNFDADNLIFVKNSGNDFPNIPNESIDLIFSFGTFVHLDLEIIDQYLRNMRRLLKPESTVVVHYSDKTKPMAQMNSGFSDNDPERMCALVESHGYRIHEADDKTMWHSAVVRFGL